MPAAATRTDECYGLLPGQPRHAWRDRSARLGLETAFAGLLSVVVLGHVAVRLMFGSVRDFSLLTPSPVLAFDLAGTFGFLGVPSLI